METPVMKRAISLQNIVDDDPELVAVHGVTSDVYDVFEEMLQQVCATEILGSDREREAVRRWTAYLGTLAAEMLIATSHLAVADNPRAQLVLNRNIFEYFVRNQWMMRHPSEALRLLDSLEALVAQELQRSPGLFDKASRDAIQSSYDAWAAQHPDLEDKVSSETRFTDMSREVLDTRFSPEFFWSYGFPSIIGHGKPHGIPDVLTPIGGGRVSRTERSAWLDRRVQLATTAGYGLQYASFVGLNYGLDLSPVHALNQRFADVLTTFGVTPEQVAVRKIT